MKKGPEIRIIGNTSEEKKEQAREKINQALFNHFEILLPDEKELLKKFEYPKSKKEIALINFANEETSQLMREAGIEPYDIPVENIHIIPPELYKKFINSNSEAAAFFTNQGILFDAQHFRDNPVYFGAIILHEMLHLKLHSAIEIQEEDEKIKKTIYRTGVIVYPSQKYIRDEKHHRHFVGLHEAIVAETEKRFLKKLLEHPELAEERGWLISDEAKEIKRKIIEEKKILEDDIIWVGKNGKNDWRIVSYLEQRNVLNYICAEIQKQFSNRYKSADDVYKVFLNANFTGKLLTLGRLVEKTFGKGSFRLLGNMDINSESGILHLESLKKARTHQIKKSLNNKNLS
jgi:hypothetical protein